MVVELVVAILKIGHINKNRMSVIFRRYKPVVQEVGESPHNEALRIESNSVECQCVLSNCVINLLPMKVLLKEVRLIIKRRVVLDEVRYFSSS